MHTYADVCTPDVCTPSAWCRQSEGGIYQACFTSRKVQILTRKHVSLVSAARRRDIRRASQPPTTLASGVHTSAYVCIRQHTSAYIRQHTYVSIRQHAYVSIRTSAYVSIHTSAYVSIRQHTYVSIRAYTCFTASDYLGIRCAVYLLY
jgi:hypothetical protein